MTTVRVALGARSYDVVIEAGLLARAGEQIAPLARGLEDAGYRGWYVLEQDTMLADAPDGTAHSPLDDVSNSVAYLMSVGTR